jgi:uncharacterized protein
MSTNVSDRVQGDVIRTIGQPLDADRMQYFVRDPAVGSGAFGPRPICHVTPHRLTSRAAGRPLSPSPPPPPLPPSSPELQCPTMVQLSDLCRYAIARSLFAPTTLKRAIARLGFVQADPIRAPARAQDLTLRLRVVDYRVGDLERRYARLGIEEDFFINYGFMPPELQALMHPRSGLTAMPKARARQARQILAFVVQQGRVHPRDVEQHLGAGTETNYWGGASNVTTRLLDQLHYRGLLRVAARDGGIRLYAPAAPADRRAKRDESSLDALIDFAVHKYAPLPAASLAQLIARLRYGAPQWKGSLRNAVQRAKQRLASAHVTGTDWFWPAAEEVPERSRAPDERVRLLAPFDPVVWDRRRFELFWGWQYRFEAYTPAVKRKLGYYALPLLWRDQVVGWGNLKLGEGRLSASFGYVTGKAPAARAFKQGLEEELADIERFLGGRGGR